MSSHPPSWATDAPYLERYPEQGGPAERIPVVKVPWTLGRAESADHTVYSGPVSKHHAAIIRVGDRFAVRDLDSTNGTFVNGRRVTQHVLEDGDIIHLAHIEFCFRAPGATTHVESAEPSSTTQTQALPMGEPASLIRGVTLLRELIATEAVATLYQPIVDLHTRAVIGFEALSRGTHPGLSSRPDRLLSLAEQCGMVIELSQLFRRLAVDRSRNLPPGGKVFLNVHAREVADAGLIDSLAALLGRAADHPLVIEVPESSVTDVGTMARHRDALASLGIELAYDDFGAGQARLTQLTDVPPAYLKLDKVLVQGIEAEPRQAMLRALIDVARTLGVAVIAECLDTEEKVSICLDLGCDFGQGFFLGEPRSASFASVPPPADRTVQLR